MQSRVDSRVAIQGRHRADETARILLFAVDEQTRLPVGFRRRLRGKSAGPHILTSADQDISPARLRLRPTLVPGVAGPSPGPDSLL